MSAFPLHALANDLRRDAIEMFTFAAAVIGAVAAAAGVIRRRNELIHYAKMYFSKLKAMENRSACFDRFIIY